MLTEQQIRLLMRGVALGISPHEFPENEIAEDLTKYILEPNEFNLHLCLLDYNWLKKYFTDKAIKKIEEDLK